MTSITTGQVEIMDMRGLDVRHDYCRIEFTVWCPVTLATHNVECFYTLKTDLLFPSTNPDHEMWGNTPEPTIQFVLDSDACKADAKELILNTRTTRKEMN